MQLKPYQQQALTALETFLARSAEVGAAAAFDEVTGEPALRARLGRYAKPYKPPSGLAETPYCCIRLPTGGGKTLMAAHAVRAARDAGLDQEYPLVLWLVTSNAIRTQTADALANPRHPYRATLDEAFGGRVRVFDVADFAQARPQDLAQNACIFVGTVQALRVENTEGRKVYAHHEDLEGHFSRLSAQTLARFPGLERTEAGAVKFSFANLLHLHGPLMIVDEAHNVVTNLSDQMRERINPSAVVEFTATPKGRSNILFNATAAELKAEQMIKLPIVLQEHSGWQASVAGAVAERAALAEMAAKEREYLRPITLYQAEPKNRDVTVEVLKRHLIDDLGIDEKKVVVATGDERGLDGIDLSARDCPIEHIITVEALKEGWDCPFAYVFCSVASIRSSTAVEQLLGRVLRMPYASRRKDARLNRAYAHVSEPSFYAAATALRDALVDMGFDDSEAEEAIEHPTLPLEGLFGMRDSADPPFEFTLEDTAEFRAVLVEAGIAPLVTKDGKIMLRSTDIAREGVATKIMAAATSPVAEALGARLQALAPASRGERLMIPRLATRVQGELVLGDAEHLLEYVEWRLSAQSPVVAGLAAALTETVNRFEIDVRGNQVVHAFLSADEDLLSDHLYVDGWTTDRLVAQLDPLCRQQDVSQPDLVGWLTAVVRQLVETDGLSVPQLFRMKHALARRLRLRIDELRAQHRRQVVQQFLFDPGAPVESTWNEAFVFEAGMYVDVPAYRGATRFSSHFLDRVPAFDGDAEVKCAQYLDSLKGVKWWVRNVARHPASFWLQTSKDRTYPDFIALLDDGRTLVVEYKGQHLWADAAEDRAIGAVWERAGGGLYVMVGEKVDGLDLHGQLRRKLG